MIKPNETVSIGWCDNGTTDGRFTEGLIPTELAKRKRASSRLPVIGSWYGLPAPKWKDDWERIQ